jgi:sugar lactone lactonase YvrE
MPMAASPSGDRVTDEAIASMATLAVDCRCALGESILWCERRSTLFWADIDAAGLWMHVPGNGSTRHWTLPERLGSLALCENGGLLLGLAKGLYWVDIDAAIEATTATTLSLQRLQEVEPGSSETRINDGRSDRHGHFVFGTKSQRADKAPVGSFYQYSAQHGLRRLDLPGVSIPNSICFSADGRTLYYCDSLQPRISCCDYDPHTASVFNSRVFVELDHPQASPDGSIVDAEGHLWNAQWGASQVVRYRPDGQTDRIVAVPVTQPSCCTIGGEDLDQLYITSARAELGEATLAWMPTSGGVFQLALPRALGLRESRVAVDAGHTA